MPGKPGIKFAVLKQEDKMKKIFVSLLIVWMSVSFASLLNGIGHGDYGKSSERIYKSSYSPRDSKQYRGREIRRVHPYKYKIPRHISRRDLRKIRRYERKIAKYKWRISHMPMSRYRCGRCVRKIEKYRYKIDRILRRYRYWGGNKLR